MAQAFTDGDQVCAIGEGNAGRHVPELVRMEVLNAIPLPKRVKILRRRLRVQPWPSRRAVRLSLETLVQIAAKIPVRLRDTTPATTILALAQ